MSVYRLPPQPEPELPPRKRLPWWRVLLCELGDHVWERARHQDTDLMILWTCCHCERWISFRHEAYAERLKFLRAVGKKTRSLWPTFRNCCFVHKGTGIQVYWNRRGNT